MLPQNGFKPKSAVSRLLWTLGVVLAATAASLILQRGMGVERISLLYFGAVLVCAGWLGVWYGLVAAMTATVAAGLAHGAAAPIVLGAKQDVVNLVLYAAGAWVVGLYMDEARRERDALMRLTAAGRPEASGLAAQLVASPVFRWPPLIEALRILGALILSVASMGIGVLVQQLVGAGPVSMIYLTGVVLAASLLGTRAGLVTALSNVIAYDYFVLEPRFTLTVNNAASGVNLIVFLAVGWQVGLFAERVRYERRAVRSLFDAGRSFSGTADETALRQLIAEAVAMVARGRYVLVRDEAGRTAAEHGERPENISAPPDGPPEGRKRRDRSGWRVRPLQAEDEALGSVAWLAAADDHDLPIEATVNVLVDLGAAAIARARLSTEHAHLEVVAQTEQLRRALLASVSHDLRTPLAGIMGSSTSLLDHFDKYGDEVRRDLLSNIREQSFRLNRYVENLLGMTRLESGALQPKLEPLSLEAIVFESWEVIADSAGATRPLLRVEEEQLVMADAALLRQVVSNLLENAVKFSPAGSTVEVASEQRGGLVILTIADQGVGASEAELQHFFEPFVRGKQSKGSGVGLGLFIARSFLEAMGGTIAARGRRDGRPGLVFEVALPTVRQLEPVQ